MKTIIVTLSLLSAALASAAPATAECASIDESGTSACADVESHNSFNVFASQAGAGGAWADAYEFSFFGQTFRGKNAFVYTDPSGPAGWNSVGFSDFCFASGSQCSYQDHSVFVSSEHAGFAFVGVSQSPGERTLCYSIGDEFGCQSF